MVRWRVRHPVMGGVGMWLAIKLAALAAVFVLFAGSESGRPGSVDAVAGETAAHSAFGSNPVRLDFRH